MTRSLSFSSSIWSDSGPPGPCRTGAPVYLGVSKAIRVYLRVCRPTSRFARACGLLLPSELEAGRARRVRQRANAPMEQVSAAVEDDLVDPFGEERLRDRVTDALGRVEFVRLFHLGAYVARERRRVRDRLAGDVVNHLGVDVFGAPEDGETGTIRRPADLAADAQPPALSPDDLHGHRLLPSAGLRRLAGLLADLLALVAHALAAVRLGRPKAADLGGGLTHFLFVRTGQDEDRSLRVAGNLAFDPFGKGKRHRVREPEAEVQDLTLELGPVARPDELERLRVALGDADDHPADERPGEPLETRAVAALDRGGDEDGAALDLRGHARRKSARERALRALDLDRAFPDGRGDALGEGDRPLADARLPHPALRLRLGRHGLTTPRRAARRPRAADAPRDPS